MFGTSPTLFFQAKFHPSLFTITSSFILLYIYTPVPRNIIIIKAPLHSHKWFVTFTNLSEQNAVLPISPIFSHESSHFSGAALDP